MFSTRSMTLAALVLALGLAACGDDSDNNGTTNNTSVNNTTTGMDAGNNVETDAGDTTPEEDMSGGEVDMGPPPGVERLPVSFAVFPPVPVSCDDPGARQRFPFAYVSNDVFPVVEGDLVNGRVVEPNTTLDIGTFAVRRPRVQVLQETTCQSEADCPAGYKCAAAGLPGAAPQCTVQTGFEFVPRTVRSEVDNGLNDTRQLVTILIENSTSLDGRLPTPVSGYFDENGERDAFADPARATDPTLIHREAIKNFSVGIASVADPQNTSVSIWQYSGTAGPRVRPLTGGGPGDLDDFFVNDLSVGEAVIDGMPNPINQPGNMYQAVNEVLNKDLTLDKYDGYEKFLFIFTDGANEVYDPNATLDSVRQRLVDEGIKTYIVHLDNQIDSSLLRDLPSYYEGAPACAGDADCENFETCRPATVYAQTEGEPVTQTPVSHCMPNYVDGRLGPIDGYADLACQTGGNYIYVSEPELMRQWWRNLPNVINGLFSVEADLSAYENQEVEPGFYRISATILGLLGAGSLEQNFSTPAGTRVSADSRPIVRFGRPTN
jgi:hypothetical protein